LVPEAVWQEVVVRGQGKPAAELVASAADQEWLRRQSVADSLAVTLLQTTLGSGEATAIVLARQVQAEWVLLDDDLARAHATAIGLQVKGTAGILLAGHIAGWIDDLQAGLDELRTRGFWLSDDVYHAIIAEAQIGRASV